MPRVTRAQHLAESEAARRMYALNQTREAGQAGGSNADFQSNQGQARRPRSEVDPGEAARRPSPFLDPDPNIGRNSMDFNPPPSERGRESGGVPEEEVTPNIPRVRFRITRNGRRALVMLGVVFPATQARLPPSQGKGVSPPATFPDESDFDDRDDFSRVEEVDYEETGRGRRRGNRMASDQRRFLESNDSSDEDYAPSHSLAGRTESLGPVGSRVSLLVILLFVQFLVKLLIIIFLANRLSVPLLVNRLVVLFLANRLVALFPVIPLVVLFLLILLIILPIILSLDIRLVTQLLVTQSPQSLNIIVIYLQTFLAILMSLVAHKVIVNAAGIGEEFLQMMSSMDNITVIGVTMWKLREIGTTFRVISLLWTMTRKLKLTMNLQGGRRIGGGVLVVHLPLLEGAIGIIISLQPLVEEVREVYLQFLNGFNVTVGVGGLEVILPLPDDDVTRNNCHLWKTLDVQDKNWWRTDPVGMLTSVSQAVITVLRNGWCEPIPLGHFARRNNLLFTSYTALDASSFHITEGGQVRLKTKRLHDISIMDLTINDWNEIKRNMPKAIREHLIPDDEVFPGSTEALAAAEMIENLFRIVDDQARIGEEYIPLMFYVDTKIQFWRARPERKERVEGIGGVSRG
ncbi:hypothetical protein EV360DRAFT_76427 [Lentinula raphanica]|nr:hypothetical protein EV360DRAFT_76427 [Lentinula raphanica]